MGTFEKATATPTPSDTFHKDPDHYTYWDQRTGARERNIGWRIDYFFVDTAFLPNVKNAYIMPAVMGSDHCPIGLEITLK